MSSHNQTMVFVELLDFANFARCGPLTIYGNITTVVDNEHCS